MTSPPGLPKRIKHPQGHSPQSMKFLCPEASLVLLPSGCFTRSFWRYFNKGCPLFIPFVGWATSISTDLHLQPFRSRDASQAKAPQLIGCDSDVGIQQINRTRYLLFGYTSVTRGFIQRHMSSGIIGCHLQLEHQQPNLQRFAPTTSNRSLGQHTTDATTNALDYTVAPSPKRP